MTRRTLLPLTGMWVWLLGSLAAQRDLVGFGDGVGFASSEPVPQAAVYPVRIMMGISRSVMCRA